MTIRLPREYSLSAPSLTGSQSPRAAPLLLRAGLVLAAVVLSMAGCSGRRPTEPAAVNRDAMAVGSFNCKTPYFFTRDCSMYTGASKTIKIDDTAVEIAGSGDGKVVLVMDAKLAGAIPSSAVSLSLLKPPASETYKDTSLARILRRLSRGGIAASRIRPVTRDGQVYGFVLEMNGDGYAELNSGGWGFIWMPGSTR